MRRDLLAELQSGSRDSLDRLVPRLYQELRAIAHRQISRQPRGGTLDTTALVHEAYLKVADRSGAEVQDRSHFLALASLAMRHVLVDRAKARTTLKRGGVRGRITFDDEKMGVEDQSETMLQLDEALDYLAEL